MMATTKKKRTRLQWYQREELDDFLRSLAPTIDACSMTLKHIFEAATKRFDFPVTMSIVAYRLRELEIKTKRHHS